MEGAGSTFQPYSGDPSTPDFVGPLPNTPTRFVNGVVVLDQRTGQVYTGTVELQPTLDRIDNGIPYPHGNDGSVFQNRPPIGGNGQPLLPLGYTPTANTLAQIRGMSQPQAWQAGEQYIQESA